MRLVLDTNVVVSALLWSGAPRQLLNAGRLEQMRLFTSVPLIAELTKTLSRAKFDKKIRASLLSVNQLVDLYVEFSFVVFPVQTPRLAPDPDDDVVIGTALAANADLLVTGDQALLSVSAFKGGRIVSVQDALNAISCS